MGNHIITSPFIRGDSTGRSVHEVGCDLELDGLSAGAQCGAKCRQFRTIHLSLLADTTLRATLLVVPQVLDIVAVCIVGKISTLEIGAHDNWSLKELIIRIYLYIFLIPFPQASLY